MKKTNAARILEKHKVRYKLLEYEVDENDLSAENVAGKLDVPLDVIFKTLVARGDKTGVIIACVPGGVSPIGMKKSYPTYIDITALSSSEIVISAGVRGCQIVINPTDLIKVVEAKTGEIII